ncbi:MAG: hypothetical protein M3N93_15325, partial [Acidobacteriota bacterium]|nr:hypothetical protein [Acidobacteriota bacterium]
MNRTEPRSLACLVSGVLMGTMSFVLGIYWPLYGVNQNLAIMFLRPSILGAAVGLAFVWYRRSMTMAERRLIVLFSVEFAF